MGNYTTAQKSTSLDFSPDPAAAEIIAEQAAEALREIDDWKQVAAAFLAAKEGDRAAAEEFFERQIDRLLDGGALSMRAYRGILKGIREL